MKIEEYTVIEHLGSFYAAYAPDDYIPSYYRDNSNFTIRKATSADLRTMEQRYFQHQRDEVLPDFWPVRDDHWAHPDPEDVLKIRYIDSRDKYVSTKPGRYIKKFFPHLDDAEFSARWGQNFEPMVIHFATTPDEIEEVYRNGPSSCMAYEPSHFSSPVHPTRVYGAGDLAIAYGKRGERITARALCWPKHKIYGRVYGDETRLVDALEELDYGQDETGFDGARLLKIEHQGQYVCPYIDHYETLELGSTHLIIGGDDLGCQQQHGLTEKLGELCEFYDERRDDEFYDVQITEGGRIARWCEYAVDYNAFWCDFADRFISNDIGVQVYTGDVWSPQRIAAQAGYCNFTDEYFPLSMLLTTADGELINKEHFENMDAEDRPELERLAA